MIKEKPFFSQIILFLHSSVNRKENLTPPTLVTSLHSSKRYIKRRPKRPLSERPVI